MSYEAFLFRNYKLVTAVKAAIAVAVSLVLGYAWKRNPEVGWIAVTAIVLMAATPNVGDVINRSIQRFIGTIIAGAIALFVVWGLDDEKGALWVVLIVGVIVFSWMGQQRRTGYIGEMSAMTLVILLAFVNTQAALVGWRALNIAIGGIVAFAVTRFVFPIKAERRFHFAVAHTLRSLADFYDLIMGDEFPQKSSVARLQSRIDSELSEQRELVAAARVERVGLKPGMIEIFEDIVHTEAEMLFSMIVMRRERWRSQNSRKAIDDLLGIVEHRQIVLLSLHSLAETAASEDAYVPPRALVKTSKRLVESMPSVDDPSVTAITPHSFAFTNNELSAQIVRMSNLLRKMARSAKMS